MTDIQFIQASKEFFFQYFFTEVEKPSLLNMEELVENYRQTILQDYENKNKNRSGHASFDSQDHPGPMPADNANETG